MRADVIFPHYSLKITICYFVIVAVGPALFYITFQKTVKIAWFNFSNTILLPCDCVTSSNCRCKKDVWSVGPVTGSCKASTVLLIWGPSSPHAILGSPCASPIGRQAAHLSSDWLNFELHSLPMCASCEQPKTCFSFCFFPLYVRISRAITVLFNRRVLVEAVLFILCKCLRTNFIRSTEDAWRLFNKHHKTGKIKNVQQDYEFWSAFLCLI